MPRSYTPAEAAARVQKWAAVGFDYAIVEGLREALEVDRQESLGRLAGHRKSGALASTLRVTSPSSRKAAKVGLISVNLVAGSRSASKPVPYASVLQTGQVYPGAAKSRDHDIVSRGGGMVGPIGGRFFKSVHHPGSRFPQLDYLKVSAPRVQATVDSKLQRSADREIG
jgi:hypothetical protein